MTDQQKKYVESKKSSSIIIGAVIGGLVSFVPFILTADLTCRSLKGNCEDVWIVVWLIITTIDCFFLSFASSFICYKLTCKRMDKLFGGSNAQDDRSRK